MNEQQYFEVHEQRNHPKMYNETYVAIQNDRINVDKPIN